MLNFFVKAINILGYIANGIKKDSWVNPTVLAKKVIVDAREYNMVLIKGSEFYRMFLINHTDGYYIEGENISEETYLFKMFKSFENFATSGILVVKNKYKEGTLEMVLKESTTPTEFKELNEEKTLSEKEEIVQNQEEKEEEIMATPKKKVGAKKAAKKKTVKKAAKKKK